MNDEIARNTISQKDLASLLFGNNILRVGKQDPNDLISMVEFQILRVLANANQLSDSEIEEKYEAPHGLTYVLSNLSADGYIVQTASYKWRLSDQIRKIIQNFHTPEKELGAEEPMKPSTKDRYAKKMSYKKIVDFLGNSSYIPSGYHSVEDLYNIAELEVLVLLNENEQLSSSELEDLYTNTNPVSLTLSNLKADGLIRENAQLKWELDKSFIGKQSKQHTTKDIIENQTTTIEQAQFLKQLIEVGYFKRKDVKEIIKTAEFKVLFLIYSKAPILQDEIEQELVNIPSLSMIMSNLKIDGLIYQDNDYFWMLNEDFRKAMQKQKVQRDEFAEEIALFENLEMEEVQHEKEEKIQIYPHEELQERLIKHGYLKAKVDNPSDLDLIPEFNVIKIIWMNSNISTAELELQSHLSSLSLTLSNLQADNIIHQTPEFNWELNSDIAGRVRFEKLTHTEPSEPVEEQVSIEDQIQPEHEFDVDQDMLMLLITACRKKGYMSGDERSCSELDILRLVAASDRVEGDKIKRFVSEMTPVHVSRLLSKLVAEDCLMVDDSMVYELSPLFKEFLIEDEENERIAKEEKERERLEHEKTIRLEETEKIMRGLGDLLRNSGIITSESADFKELMEIPEFEIVSIIGKDGPIAIDTLKEKASDIPPVQITHILSKLRSKQIIVDIDEQLDLSDEVKSQLFV